MKQILLVFLLLTSFLSKAQNSLRLENNTAHDIFSAYAIYEPAEKCWVSYGWYKIPAYGNFSIDLGGYNGGVYIHGEHQGLVTNKSWGSGEFLCVNELKPFRIACARVANCGNKKQFDKIQISDGSNLFRFNP